MTELPDSGNLLLLTNAVDKKRPSYDLVKIKAAFSSLADLSYGITLSAFQGARALGISRAEIIMIIASLKPADFYKSMTSYRNHKIWQDVYHARFRDNSLYLKFTEGDFGKWILLSFKEK